MDNIRRKFLLICAYFIMSPSLSAKSPPTKNKFDRVKLLLESKSMFEVGKEYLRLYPSEADKEKLFEMVPVYKVHKKWCVEVQCQIKRDFTNEDIVNVNGWILARTEARIAGLSWLSYVSS